MIFWTVFIIACFGGILVLSLCFSSKTGDEIHSRRFPGSDNYDDYDNKTI
jgi:hypothetical protein